MRILVIDDDVELTDLLREFLSKEGYDIAVAHDGPNGVQAALSGSADLVVLDVMLPGMDGFEVLRRLRSSTRLPIIMLTARGEDVDRIVGLELGADDYMPKPFNPRELLARIRAILRRIAPRDNDGKLQVGAVSLDPASREVICGGQLLELTTIEFDILELLMRAAGRVLSRDQIMEALYNRKASPFDRAIDMHISHLRKKLSCDGGDRIKTIRGVGYQFARSGNEQTE